MGHRIAVALAIIVPVVGAASWVSASEDHAPTIHGCVDRQNGQLRIVSVGERCRRHESALDWNAEGPAGPQGGIGPAGPQGEIGAAGAAGARGEMGPVGPEGDRGPAGAAGDAGPAGAQGPAGAPGDAGPAGAQGPAGAPGDTGPAGPQGDSGPAGAPGDTGPAGPQGDSGPAGAPGDTGPAGPQGDSGPAGPQGVAGPAGPQGEPGPAGPQGTAGPAGAAGTPGISGWEQKTATVPLGAGATAGATVRCSAGKQVFGGGFATPGTSTTIIESRPATITGSQNPGWTVWGRNSGTDTTLTVYALCATAT